MDNNGSPDGEDHQSAQSDSRQDSEHEGSNHGSENGHSPRPAGRSRSRFVPPYLSLPAIEYSFAIATFFSTYFTNVQE